MLKYDMITQYEIDTNSYISKSIDEGNFTIDIFGDLRKALDTVDRNILLQK